MIWSIINNFIMNTMRDSPHITILKGYYNSNIVNNKFIL